ncbi:MAG TPA: TlpA disulfide reductase family protein [Pyrinomonadaceae bacterium]|nr:TlpA disulfide reductase family protein [Pyrinomonadaceae bacterium]
MDSKEPTVRADRARFSDKSVSPGFIKKIFDGWGLLHLANMFLLTSTVLGIVFLTRLSSENAALRSSNSKLASRVSIFEGGVSGPPTAEVGDLVPSFETVDLEGRRAAVTYDGSNKYLIFVFSPQCGVCKQQFPLWERISASARSKGYHVVGLSTGPERAAAATKAMEQKFQMLMMPNIATQRAYRVVAEPLTMLVSPRGRVEWARYGELTDEEIRDLDSAIEYGGVKQSVANER